MSNKALDNIVVARLVHEMELRKEIEVMTDGELAQAMIKEIWARTQLWTRAGVLVDEAITRLKHADTRRRWQERKEARRTLQQKDGNG